MTSAFIIDLQSQLQPDYEQMNNTLLEMLLKATTGSLPPDSLTSILRWTGPDPVIVQVQCIFYAALCATLLASFFAMLGKQWLNRYRQNEIRGSTADRCRVRERKLTGIETWKFNLVMEFLPLILQFSLVLLGFALSRYLWEVNRLVSSVVVGFMSFGFIFYFLIVTVSTFSFDCPFQTPASLLIRFAVALVIPHWRSFQHTMRPKQQPPGSGTPSPQDNSASPTNPLRVKDDLEAGENSSTAPAATGAPPAVAPLFTQEIGTEEDRLDARCITRMFAISTDADVITSIINFIPEIVWHSGIKDVPLKRIYDILTDCIDFSGPHPVVIPRLRDVAYRTAKAFVHIALQRQYITRHEEQRLESWTVLCANHRLMSLPEDDTDSDLNAALYMVDLALGHQYKFPWYKLYMSTSHLAWMSHTFVYRALHEGELSEFVTDFIKDTVSSDSPGDTVIMDCLFMIGLMIGIRFHVVDATMRDKRLDSVSLRRRSLTLSP